MLAQIRLLGICWRPRLRLLSNYKHPLLSLCVLLTWLGARWPKPYAPLGVGVGVAKAVLGLGLRPVSGTLEAVSKTLQGTGLLCLGKRGIQVGGACGV